MNNPNPFVPKGSLLEQQCQRRSRLKFAVFCVLTVSVTGLVAMLIQGCKRETPNTDLNPPSLLDAAGSNMVPLDAVNPPMTDFSNPPAMLPPDPSNPPVVIPPLVVPDPVAPAGSEYVVIKGDSLEKIAKKTGVKLKALQDANPSVVPTKLKIGQKLVIPAGGNAGVGSVAPSVVAVAGGGSTTSYTVKSGDTLTKIAKIQGTTVKAIQAANELVTTKIKVGQKLKIPSKAEVVPPAPAPVMESAPAPMVPPYSVPAPTTPVPGQQ